MIKLLKEGFIILMIFFGIFMGFFLIYRYSAFENKRPKASDIETKLGEVLWQSIRETETVILDQAVTEPANMLVNKICEENRINREKIKVHVIENSQVNAFTFPDNYLVIYTGLLQKVDNEAALAGVISHEIAHMELNHVMKKLGKEIGLAVLLTISSGGSAEVTTEAIRMLASTAYDREMEREADEKAVEYMLKAKINPEEFANFMYQLSLHEPDIVKNLAWISTHPETEQRSRDIIEHAKKEKVEYKEILDPKTWKGMKERLGE
jgi:predicted Zn-dependent protease